MAHISLLIKGPVKNARRAAARHGIPVESCRVVGKGRLKPGADIDVQCYARCTPSMNKKVVEWFTERGHAKAGRGFPPGTLTYHGAFCEGSTGLRGPRGRRKRRK